jgi:plasmid replication initiation protein
MGNELVILYAVSKLDVEREKFNLLSLNVKEFTELIGSTQERYTEIREIVRDLRSKEITINTAESELITGWLSSIEYIKNTGKIELEFSEKLMPYLLQLKTRFTKYQLKNILNLKNKHSIRIYELLKQYEKIGKREVELKELRSILSIKDDEYTRFDNFDKMILKIPKEEINKHTDIKIDYEKIKTGRKITSILFKIESKYQEKEIFTNDIDSLRANMSFQEEHFNDKQILSIYEKAVEMAGNEDINIFEYIRLNYIHIKDKARNKYAYLIKALENDYAVAIAQIRVDYYIEQ